MEKTIETYSPSQALTYAGRNLRISLNIDTNEYDIPVSSLFDVAVRDNPKRRFLFVSKVLGKHLPIRPLALRVIGALLAGCWYQKLTGTQAEDSTFLSDSLVKLQQTKPMSETEYNSLQQQVNKLLAYPLQLPERTLFIGFAETATGIAQSVFQCFANASYIHTTREVLEGLEPTFVFSEEHSHAVEHALYTLDKDYLSSFDRIVLIDDELTTGNTALNLMKKLPGDAFGLISILDWRSQEHMAMFEETNGIEVVVCSLLKGHITEVCELETERLDPVVAWSDSVHRQDSFTTNIYLQSTDSINGWLKHTGRFGLSDKAYPETEAFIKEAATTLREIRTVGRCLVLGTEEFIYLPCMIANELGNEVYFHSTTRSPILAQLDHTHVSSNPSSRQDTSDSVGNAKNPNNSDIDDNYCIRNKVRFSSPGKDLVMNHIYNIPFHHYDQIILFTEKPLCYEDTKMFRKIFSTFGINNMIFVAWKQ